LTPLFFRFAVWFKRKATRSATEDRGNLSLKMKKRETNLPLSKHNFLHKLPYTNCWTSIKKNFQHCKPSTVTFLLLRGGAADAHGIERAVDEGEGNGKESRGEDVRQVGTLRGGHAHGKLHGQKAK
jgi:hypothetical protein